MSEQTQPSPVLRIVRGDATPDEVAALVAVLAAAGAPEPDAPVGTPSAWNDRAAATRGGLPHGPGAWRSSAWPR